jgi:putative SOS response-associated peptidase YedK
MCGRYRLSHAERFAHLNGLEFADGMPADEFSEVRLGGGPFPARYNVAPTQRMPVVFDENPRQLGLARWGLVPSWAKDPKIGNSLINARAETVASKPAYRAAWKKRRCLVPADGFYEWQKAGAAKIPQHILMKDGEPFAFAGLWEIWRDPAAPPEVEPLRTFTIITGEPNALVAPIHDRMPVILPRDRYVAWLSPDTPEAERAAMLVPFPAEQMHAYPISSRVNSPRNDDAALIEEVSADRPLPTQPKPASDQTQPDLFG